MPLLLLTLLQLDHGKLIRMTSSYLGQSVRCKTYQMRKFCPSLCQPEPATKMQISLPRCRCRCTIIKLQQLSLPSSQLWPHSSSIVINRLQLHWLLQLWMLLLTTHHWHSQHTSIRVRLHLCQTLLFLSSLQWPKSLPPFHNKGRAMTTVITKMVWSNSIWNTHLEAMHKADTQRVLSQRNSSKKTGT